MQLQVKSLRPFIGCKNFETSVQFYKALGFTEIALSPGFSLFSLSGFNFYLQDAYVKDWLENTMLFFEVPDADECFNWLNSLTLPTKFSGVKVLPVKRETWGAECFIIDPGGVLLHFGEFYKS